MEMIRYKKLVKFLKGLLFMEKMTKQEKILQKTGLNLNTFLAIKTQYLSLNNIYKNRHGLQKLHIQKNNKRFKMTLK